MAVNTVADVIGDRARASVAEGEMRFTVDNPSESSVALLKGLVIHLEALKEQYPKYIKVIILKHKNGGKSNA